MTRYEKISADLSSLRVRRTFAVAVPTLLVAGLIAIATKTLTSLSPWLVGLITLPIAPFIIDRTWSRIFQTYRIWSERSAELIAEIEGLRGRVESIFAQYPVRTKGEQFKRAYGLEGMTVRELEQVLSVAMYREAREVFVTAFMRAGVVVRVTASIGTPFRCGPADDPSQWPTHVERLLCDEIRQYHNHPVHNGRTEPSAQDFRSSLSLRSALDRHANKLRSFIIYWNEIREWKVLEYNQEGRHWLLAEFDVAS